MKFHGENLIDSRITHHDLEPGSSWGLESGLDRVSTLRSAATEDGSPHRESGSRGIALIGGALPRRRYADGLKGRRWQPVHGFRARLGPSVRRDAEHRDRGAVFAPLRRARRSRSPDQDFGPQTGGHELQERAGTMMAGGWVGRGQIRRGNLPSESFGPSLGARTRWVTERIALKKAFRNRTKQN